jgi:hypothetical protein
MHNVEATLLKRGLFRLGTAKTEHLSNFSGADEAAVDAYLATRPDLVHPREPGGPWKLLSAARETLMAEIAAGIERDPERLSDYLQPEFRDRLRSSLGTIELALDGMASGSVRGDRLLEARIFHAGKAIRELRRHGRDVSDEELRISACEARYLLFKPDMAVED